MAASSLAMPMTSAPTIAPYGSPTLPKTAAATMISRKLPPVSDSNVPRSMASATPARPASRPDSSQAALTTRVGRDADGAGQRAVVGGGPHRLAEPGVLEQQVQAEQAGRGEPDDGQLPRVKTMPRKCTGGWGGSW